MIFEKYIDSFKIQVCQPVLRRVYLVHLSLVTLPNQKFRNATILLVTIVTLSIYYGSTVVLTLCSYCGPYINSGFCGFHELYGHYDPCDNISFYKCYGLSCHSRCGYHGCYSCHKNHGHCNIYGRLYACKMSLCGRFHAKNFALTILCGLLPTNIVRLYYAYNFY